MHSSNYCGKLVLQISASCFDLKIMFFALIADDSVLLLCSFSIWNTMMGTSILSMPYALEKVT
jgi:hypothetical protein